MIKRSQLVYKIVSSVPYGNVLTYNSLARLAGIKNPRLVGSILHKNKDFLKVPCHRVVNVQGEVAKAYAGGGAKVQTKKLSSEGIPFINNRIDVSIHTWKPSIWHKLYFFLLTKLG